VIGEQVHSAGGCVLIVDPDKHKVARDLVNVWCLALQALAESSQFTASEEELSEFVDGLKNNIENQDYQLYCNMYRPTWICLICRYLTTGRKPA
jgi:hypothetical protein